MSIKQIAIPKKKRLKLQRPLNILSLDFDYFLKFENDDASILAEFPDGTEAFMPYNDVVWAIHLAHKEIEDKINTVKCNEDELANVSVFLNGCKSDIPVMIANSHVHIHDFILQHAKPGQELRILNLDFHHDAYHTEQELNCGNWVLKLKDRIDNPVVYQWVTSDNGWNASEGTIPSFVQGAYRFKTFKDYLSWNKEYKPDLIFLCRSDVWVPPHLDGYFDILMRFMASHFRYVTGEQRITKPRDLSEEIAKLREAYNTVFKWK